MIANIRLGNKLLCMLMLLMFSAVSLAQSDKEIQAAEYFFRNKEYDKAAELYERFFEKSQNKFYYQQLLTSYIKLERYREANRLVERQMKKEPKNINLYVDLGYVYLCESKKSKAEKTFAKAIEKMSPNTQQISLLASAFENVELYNYAIETYIAARKKLNNNNQFFVFELATLYEKSGRYDDMMREYLDFLELNPAMKSQMQVFLQRSMTQTDNPKLVESLRNSLVTRLQKSPNNATLLDMMIWFSVQQKDFDFAFKQAKAVDMRFPAGNAEQVYKVASIAKSNEAYDVAVQGYNYIISKGKDNPYYIKSRVELLGVKFNMINKNYTMSPKELSTLVDEYERTFAELGKNVQTIPIMRNYANILAFHVYDIQKSADILYEVIDMKGAPRKDVDAVKLELGDILIFGGEMWESALLYMQVEKANKSDIIGALAKLKNAKLSYYKGDFEWAKSQLDVLRASTSKLVANDAMELSLLISDNMEDDSTYVSLEYFAKADLLIYQNKLGDAWSYFDSILQINISHALFDEILMRKAQISLKQNNFIQADSLLQTVVNFYGHDILADDALFLLGDLNENKLNNPDKAKEYYERILLDYSASLYVVEARKRYNKLKSNNYNR